MPDPMLKLDITMDNPQEVFFSEISYATQKSIAITYAYIMAQEMEVADWPKINAAIRERWPRCEATILSGNLAQARIKKAAWKWIERWKNSRANKNGNSETEGRPGVPVSGEEEARAGTESGIRTEGEG